MPNINTVELAIDDTVQLRVTRCPFAEKSQRNNAVDVSALRRCLRYAIALSINACLLLIPGSLAKPTIASALSCCAHASAHTRTALIPFSPASTKQGSSFESRGPPLAIHRSCQFGATCACTGSLRAIRFLSRRLIPRVDIQRFWVLVASHAGGGVGSAPFERRRMDPCVNSISVWTKANETYRTTMSRFLRGPPVAPVFVIRASASCWVSHATLYRYVS